MEIKFRGKRKDNGEWVNMEYGKNYAIGSDEGDEPLPEFIEIIEVIPETVGQFIVKEGSLDIYEGEILQEWKHGGLRRTFVAKDIRTFTREYDNSGHNSTWKSIGNIIDNPELLEGQG